MVEQAREHTTIHAPVERCFQVLTDFERYPEWAGDLKEASVVERDDHGRAVVVEYRAAAMGRTTTYRLRYDYTGAPHRLGWQLEAGDIQRELDGVYELSTSEEEPGNTDVGYQLAIDLIMPIPGFVKRRAEVRILKTALDELKSRVELVAGTATD